MRTRRGGNTVVDAVGSWCPSLGASGPRLADRSAYRRDATLFASPSYVASEGKLSLRFNGTTQYATAIRGQTLDLATDSVTFSFWNQNSSGTTGVYASLASSTSGTPFLIFQASGTSITLTHRNNAGGDTSAVGGTWQSASWRLLTGVSTPSSLTLFVNGVQVATTSRTAGATSLNQVTLGALNRAGTINNYAVSSIDDARLFPRAFNATQLRQMFIAGRGFGLIPERQRRRGAVAAAGFKAYWARRQSQLIGGGL